MTEVQKRLASLSAAVEAAGDTIATHGVNGLSSLDNVRRLLGDVSLAYLEEKKSRLLTQEEVDALPTGTRVWIKWSGGNGPHQYEITSKDGFAYIVSGSRTDRVDLVGENSASNRVSLVCREIDATVV